MKIILKVSLAIIICLAAWFGYNLYLQMNAKLPVPTDPPAFSVFYLYDFSSQNITDAVASSKEIKKDILNIKDAGFQGIKINFYFKENGQASDLIAQAAAKYGLYPIGQLTGHNFKPKERAFTAEEMTDWENFVRDEVRKNKNIIYYWEIWNEPAMTELRYRYGTPAEYLSLLERTHKIIREENPAAKIIVTADYTDREAENFTNELLSLGGADYFDYLSFHPYNAIFPGARYDLAQTIEREKKLAEKYHKSLWISEIGYPDSDSNEKSQAELADTLFRAASMNRFPIIWFHWSDRRTFAVDGKSGWGLVRTDNSFKPAYDKIKIFIRGLNKN